MAEYVDARHAEHLNWTVSTEDLLPLVTGDRLPTPPTLFISIMAFSSNYPPLPSTFFLEKNLDGILFEPPESQAPIEDLRCTTDDRPPAASVLPMAAQYLSSLYRHRSFLNELW